MSGKAAAAKGAKGPKGTEKALAAAKSARVGARKTKTKLRTKVHFYKPKTKVGGNQVKKYNRTVPKGVKKAEDPYGYIKAPLTSESAMKKIEDNNTLVFLCSPTATRRNIKWAVEQVRLWKGGGGAPACA